MLLPVVSQPQGHRAWWIGAVLTLHAALLAWNGLICGPTFDEVGHLPAGLSHWELGRFDLYSVNPPLVRSIAAIPVIVAGYECQWVLLPDYGRARPEMLLGLHFIARNGERSFFLLTLARWVCIPFSLLGAWICWCWANELYGEASGFLAMLLWCLSPTVLAFGSLIVPDVAAASLAAVAWYAIWRWLRQPRWTRAYMAGLALGLACLSKFTLLLFYFLLPVAWLVVTLPRRHKSRITDVLVQGAQVLLIYLISCLVINLGYLFDGSMRRLDSYQFVSRALTGYAFMQDDADTNRFAGTSLGQFRVPLPQEMLLGIDKQRADFEGAMPSYLRGEWRDGGWYHYYLYALLVKEPLGSWILAALALFSGIYITGYVRDLSDEIVLLLPVVGFLALVSSQIGFNHHLRYVLPIYPFTFVWMSKVGWSWENVTLRIQPGKDTGYGDRFGLRAARLVAGLSDREVRRHIAVAAIAAVLVLWSVGSSLVVYPHSHAYFSELVGGPTNGRFHLLGSNSDWGQELLRLRRWAEQNPQARPLFVAHAVWNLDPALAGIPHAGLPPRYGPQPGWHALSVNELHGELGHYLYFLRFQPVTTIGYSMHVYHVTFGEANRVRRELGLPELPVNNRKGREAGRLCMDGMLVSLEPMGKGKE